MNREGSCSRGAARDDLAVRECFAAFRMTAVKHLSNTEVADWLASQRWLSLRDAAGLRFDLVETRGLTRYEATIAPDSASVGCDMAKLFLHDVPRAEFPGGLFWIARPVFASASN